MMGTGGVTDAVGRTVLYVVTEESLVVEHCVLGRCGDAASGENLICSL